MRCAKSYQDIEAPDDYKDNSDYYEEMLEKYVEKWGEQSDEDYDIIHLYWYNIVNDYLDESVLETSVNEMRESLVWYFKRIAEQRLKDIWVLKQQIEQEKNLSQCMSDHNEQLRELIRKMKRCEICKHYKWGICSYENNLSEYCIKNGMAHFEVKEEKNDI